MSIAAAINVASKYANGGAVDTNPSPAQKEAGNYKMRHITFQGIPITIENPKGTIRSGMDANGKFWSNRMTADYGYIKRTEGKDGDQVDAFVGPSKQSDRVFIIDQLHHHMEKFDEHKCLLGFNTRKQALTAYHGSYGRKYGAHHTVGAVTELSIDAFKEWLKGGGGKEPIAPDVPKFQEGGAVADEQRSLVFDPEFVGKTQPAKTPNIRVTEGHQEFEKGYVPSGRSPWNTDYPYRPILNMRGQELDALKIQTGGAVEDPPVEDVPGVGPVPTETHPGLAKIPVGLAREQAAFVAQPREIMDAQVPQMPETGEWTEEQEYLRRAGIAQQAEKEAEFGRQASLATVGTGAFGAQAGALGIAGGKLAIKPHAGEMGKSVWDLHPEEVETALQTSGTKGTSAGGTFTGFSDGVDRYVKIAKSLDHAKEEVLASKLYELAGVRAAKTELTELNGKPAVASQIIPNTAQLSEFPSASYPAVKGLQEDFPAHAWLANWDAPGVGSENPLGNILVDKAGRAHYVDFGGALRFRGLGGQKGDLFGHKVTETKTMLGDTAKNPLVASVFEGHQISPDNPVAQRIANIDNQQILDLVDAYGPRSVDDRAELFSKLIKRRDDLAKQYGIEKPHVVGGTDYEAKADWEAKKEAMYAPAPLDPSEMAKKIQQLHYGDPDAQHNVLVATEKELGAEYASKVANALAKANWAKAKEGPVDIAQTLKNFNVPDETLAVPKSEEWTPKDSLSLMQLNKLSTPTQLVHTVMNHQPVDAFKNKKLTAKQLDNIHKNFEKADLKELVSAMSDLSPEQQANVKTWMSAKAITAVKKAMYEAQPRGVAEMLVAKHDYNAQKIAQSMFNIAAKESPELVDEIFKKLPHDIQADVNAHLTEYIEHKGFDPWSNKTRGEPALSEQEQYESKQDMQDFHQASLAAGQPTAGFGIGKKGVQYSKHGPLPDAAFNYINWADYKPKLTHEFGYEPPKLKNITPQQAKQLGFNVHFTMLRGEKIKHGATLEDPYPTKFVDPKTIGKHSGERAFFAGDIDPVAKGYADYHASQSGQGPLIGEYVYRPPTGKVAEVDWKAINHYAGYSNTSMIRLIEEGHKRDLDMIVAHGISDVGHSNHTQYIILKPEGLRSLEAKFGKNNLHLMYPHLAVAGGYLGIATLKNQQEAESRYASGGAVKASKEKVHYRVGTNSEHCGICSMFRAPDSCTAVSGKIRWMDNCDYFEKRK